MFALSTNLRTIGDNLNDNINSLSCYHTKMNWIKFKNFQTNNISSNTLKIGGVSKHTQAKICDPTAETLNL